MKSPTADSGRLRPRWWAPAGVALVLAVVSGCNGGDVPTSALVTVISGEGATVPEVVHVKVFHAHGLYDDGQLVVPAVGPSDGGAAGDSGEATGGDGGGPAGDAAGALDTATTADAPSSAADAAGSAADVAAATGDVALGEAGSTDASVSAGGGARRLGTVVIYGKADDLSLRVLAVGMKGALTVSEGTLTVVLSSGKQTQVELTLRAGRLADTDADGVPDGIDNCPRVKNANQQDSNGDGAGDACTGDGGAGDDSSGDAGGAQSLGSVCSAGGECGSGFCIDGVCCDTECGQTCRACNLPGTVGVCTPVPDSQDPRGVCAAEPAESCGLDGTCNGLGACRKHRAGTICRAPACATMVDRVLAGTCDGGGECVAGEPRSCAPYACDAGGCNTSCQTVAQCAPGRMCLAGSCGLRPLGGACTGKADCDSGNCVDGACCDVATCDGPCRSCNVVGSAGSCRPIKSGEEPKAPGCAVEAASTCGRTGKCDGTGACGRYASGTACGARTCTGSAETSAAVCSGAGMCLAGRVRSCSPYLCKGDACATSCTTDAECTAGNYCAGNICRAKRSNGNSCTRAGDCQSSQCVEGICCGVACLPTQYCPRGNACQTKRVQGASCDGNGECQSGFCTDDVCCESACTETCKRCNGTTVGTCVFVGRNQIDWSATTPCRPPRSCDGAGICR